MTIAEHLCLACGLCCDGTLFQHVKLEPGDDAGQLKALGLPVRVSRGQEPVTRFRQPCAALGADCTCRIYADRPRQCRSFECGVYQDVRAGRLEPAAALRLVKQARQRADEVRRLLRALGDTDEHHALSERFRRTKRRMEAGGAGEAAVDTFAELSLAMHYLSLLTIEKFYTKAAAK